MLTLNYSGGKKEKKMPDTIHANYSYSRYWGVFFDSTQKLVGYGYSGDVAHFNKPEMDHLPKMGPLPSGPYRLHYIADDPKLGPHIFQLEPIGSFPLYGRSGFYIHGDSPALNHTGSEGCIVCPPVVRDIFKDGDILAVV